MKMLAKTRARIQRTLNSKSALKVFDAEQEQMALNRVLETAQRKVEDVIHAHQPRIDEVTGKPLQGYGHFFTIDVANKPFTPLLSEIVYGLLHRAVAMGAIEKADEDLWRVKDNEALYRYGRLTI